MKVDIQSVSSPYNLESRIVATFPDSAIMHEQMAYAVMADIAHQIADRYVEEHYGEIAARLDQNAIANLAIADASKKIAEEIRTRPVVLHDKETVVFNRTIRKAR